MFFFKNKNLEKVQTNRQNSYYKQVINFMG